MSTEDIADSTAGEFQAPLQLEIPGLQFDSECSAYKTPAATLLALPQLDDAGAQTADRYEWQAAMAAADGLSLYLQHRRGELKPLDPSQIRIICEFHEDWVIQVGSNVELVSAKHRDLVSGTWRSISSLTSEGGVGHLFSRWLYSERKPFVRLVTNAAPASGEARRFFECRELLSILDANGTLSREKEAQLQRCIDRFCKCLMALGESLPMFSFSHGTGKEVPESLRVAVQDFLRVLRLDSERPSRQYIASSAPDLYAAPISKVLGLPTNYSRPIWEAVVQAFRLRMRASGETSYGSLPSVEHLTNGRSQIERTLEPRTMNLTDLGVVVTTAVSHPNAYMPITAPRRTTKLSIKMAFGGCASTSIERAELLRLKYSAHRRERLNRAPGSIGEVSKMESSLHRIADEETTAVRTPAGTWGSQLWSNLSSRLESNGVEEATTAINGEIALGGVCHLSSQCKVWFSDYFDVNAALDALKNQKAQSDE
ncbi:MAG: hypothetical protein QM705_00170 [Ancrocorticia sp.]